jgi:hypothetical protein
VPLFIFAVLALACRHAPSSGASPVPSVSAALETDPTACGALGCRLFDTPVDAFRGVIAEKPLVLAVGEAHAQKAVSGVPSSASGVTSDMLPELRDKASDLVIELMVPPAGCEAKTAVVNKEMKKITAKQAETNKDEYVTMAEEAKKLDIEPHVLHPSCDDWKPITAPGADVADASLRLIARLMREMTKKALLRNEKAGIERMVVLYGGAIHNDVAPAEGTADYGYGPDLVAFTKGRYIELDMFVPELVRDSGLWPKFVWYAHFDKNAHPDKTTMFAPAPSSFTILLPATKT